MATSTPRDRRTQLLDLAFDGSTAEPEVANIHDVATSAVYTGRRRASLDIDMQQDNHNRTIGSPLSRSSASWHVQSPAYTASIQDDSFVMEATDPELFQAGVAEHARRLGLDPVADAEYLWLARESLVAPLPDDWYHVTATETGEPYYYNETTGESRWDHPCDEQFRQLIRDLKQKAQLNQQNQHHHQYNQQRYNLHTPQREELHTASYYGTGAAYQTLAWQDEHYNINANDSHYNHDNRPSYANYSQSHSTDYYEGYETVSSTYANGDYTAHAEDHSDYDTNSHASTHRGRNGYQQSHENRRNHSTASRTAEGQSSHNDQLVQQYLQQLQSLEQLKLEDDEVITDLRNQLASFERQLTLQMEDYQKMKGEMQEMEHTLDDYKLKLNTTEKKNEELNKVNEVNHNLERELLAARHRLEKAQEDNSDQEASQELESLRMEVMREQCERTEIQRQVDELTTIQSQLMAELGNSRSIIQKLENELAAQQAAEKQEKEKAASDAATEAAAAEQTITSMKSELGEKENEIEALRVRSKILENNLHEARNSQANERQSFQEEMQLMLARKDDEAAGFREEIEKLNKNISELLDAKELLEKQLEEVKAMSITQQEEADDQHRAIKREVRSLERELKIAQAMSKEREQEISSLKLTLENAEAKLLEQVQEVENARKQGYEEAQLASAEVIRQTLAERARVADLYAQELQTRRKLHNRLMELQGNIRVFCRVRPIQPVELKSEQSSPAVFFRENDHESLELVLNDPRSDNSDKNATSFIGQKHTFEFDYIFQPSSTQMQVFEQTRALVVSALDGFNVCIFAYGQTGSGKTHTMEGTESDRGVNYRALQELFSIRDDRIAAGNFECTMKLSILEVYNETIIDLLEGNTNSSNPGSANTKGLDVRMGKTGVYVENLIEVEVHNEKDVTDLMKLGHSHRSVGSHDFNEHSSRSHLVLSIIIETLYKTEQRKRVSKLHLIDLAGSERVSKTAASGQRLKEAQNINRSLSALGDVIAALGANSKHVPYRNSKLTFLLQESLSGNSKVLMFVNVSPVQWNASETLCSLNFASRCRNVALGQAKVNTVGSGGPSSLSVSAPSPAITSSSSSNGAGMHSSVSMNTMQGSNSGANHNSMVPSRVPPNTRTAPSSVPKVAHRTQPS